LDHLREKILDGENALEKLMRKIPGFEGYKSREQSRNADQLQRKFMARSIGEAKSRLGDAGQEMMRSGNIMLIGEVDRVSKLLDKVADRIEHAEYGYSSLFASVKIDTQELDQIYEYDLTMVNSIESISEAILGLEGSLDMEEGNPKARLRDVEKAVKNLDRMIDGRQKLLKGVE